MSDPAILDELVFGADGLLPAIIQDDENGDVLMLAWMDREAVRRTLTTGRVTFWSRSRQEYWRKGDTSGHRQYVRSVAADCDADTLLAREFVLPSPLAGTGAEVRDFAAPFFAGDRPFLSAVRALTQSIFQEFRYDTTFSDYHDY